MVSALRRSSRAVTRSVKSVMVPTQPGAPSAATTCSEKWRMVPSVGLGAIAESAGDGLQAELRPCLFHARAIIGMHALGPGIGGVAWFESEHAAIFGIAIGHVAGGVRVIDGDRRAIEQSCARSGLRIGEQRKLRLPRVRFGAGSGLFGKQRQRGALLGSQSARAWTVHSQSAQRIAARRAQCESGVGPDGERPGHELGLPEALVEDGVRNFEQLRSTAGIPGKRIESRHGAGRQFGGGGAPGFATTRNRNRCEV